MQKYVCNVCGWVYDPEAGLPEQGIEPGTPFEALPDDFECSSASSWRRVVDTLAILGLWGLEYP